MNKLNYFKYLSKLNAGECMKFIFILAIFIGCAPRSLESDKLYWTVQDLTAQKGDPIRIEVSKIDTDSFNYHYPANEHYQIKDREVVGKFTSPEGQKSVIQFWRHHLSQFPYTITQVDKLTSKLSCPFKGMDIFFDQESGQVIRLVEYRPAGGEF